MQFDWHTPMSLESLLIIFAYAAIVIAESLVYRWHRDKIFRRIFVTLTELSLYTLFVYLYATANPLLVEIKQEEDMLLAGYYLILAIPAITIIWETIIHLLKMSYDRLWQHLYDRNMMPGIHLTIDQFRHIFFDKKKYFFIRKMYHYRNHSYYSFYRILYALTVFFGSETLDDIRITYAKWMRKEILSYYINVNYSSNTTQRIIKLLTLDVSGNVALAVIYHTGLRRPEIKDIIYYGLIKYNSDIGDDFHIKSLRRNYSRLIFPA